MFKYLFSFNDWMNNLFAQEYVWWTVLVIVAIVLVVALIVFLLVRPAESFAGVFHKEGQGSVIVEKKGVLWVVDAEGNAEKFQLHQQKQVVKGNNIFAGRDIKVVEVIEENDVIQRRQAIDTEYLVVDFVSKKKLVLNNVEYEK
ncbi:hypothetical protein BN85413210 [Alteracholeplasma palmae J233]|uniref:Uncharacterized protein n=1 Tax=Alteracholeplasma palmae (strain ATCC 49389 / J233) TaxID=1318466 RepID=U4KLU1_ALTPJ|nr:hypothetical protein [Alteracholeplasma palmae]CCV64898.1 hypothetical protein BN85413210 [Alteracholeplasma palmae J233]